jgi:methionine sulfoxide reductase catalytic subunit
MADRIPDAEITPRELYFNRRTFLQAGLLAATVAGTTLLYRRLNGVTLDATEMPAITGLVTAPHANGYWVDEALTPRPSILNYNNFYEFSTDKDGVAGAAAGFKTAGWKVEVGGLVHKPRVFDLDDLRRLSPPEERVYRMRCVEAWSMVIPWVGYSLSKLLAAVEPTAEARYVAFQTLLDPKRMPNQNTDVLQWPYVEGLRLDEAMHPLTLLATGLYGQELPPQDGAPVRLVTPWKYGFKGIKSIVKITLTATEPPSTWNIIAPAEYGFFANVNPRHDHPRWSQATEQRIGESGRRPTLMFNGYAEQVASLYTGMDLDVHY